MKWWRLDIVVKVNLQQQVVYTVMGEFVTAEKIKANEEVTADSAVFFVDKARHFNAARNLNTSYTSVNLRGYVDQVIRQGCVSGFVDGCVSGFVDGCVSGFVDGCVSGFVGGCVSGCVSGFVGGCVSGCVSGFVDGCVSGFVDGCVSGFVSGYVDGCGCVSRCVGECVNGCV